MSNLMKLIGTVLALGGLVLGVLTVMKPGIMGAFSMTMDTAAFLFVGGILSLGLGAVVDAIRGSTIAMAAPRKAVVTVAEIQTVAAMSSESAKEAISGFGNLGRRTPEAAVATGTGTATAGTTTSFASKSAKADPVADTISALEQAKADVIKSMGGMESLSPPPPEPSHVSAHHENLHVVASNEEPETDDLYVVEEKVVRGRPARILSDDTVEAETDEGWMRFENLEHLNEYLDSVEEQNA